MVSEQNGFEQSARIVEAFAPGQSSDVATRLTEIAQTLRSHPAAADGFEQSALIVEGAMMKASGDAAVLSKEIAQAIRDRAIDD